MRAKFFDSIRMKLVLAMILSLLCTIFTDILILGSISLIKYQMVGENKKQIVSEYSKNDERQQAEQDAVTEALTEGSNFGSNAVPNENNTSDMAEGSKNKNRYEPNEYVPEGDRTYKFTFRIRHRGMITPHIWLDILIIFILSCFLFIAYYMVFTNHMIMYFQELNLALDRIKNGDLETTVNVRGGDELSMIAESMNEMKYELKKNIESERQSDRIKNELVTNVAHDLRTPLTSIIGYLELLHRQEWKDEQTRQKYTDTAYQKAKTLEVLINELFDYTRFQKGKVKLELAPLDITMFLEQMLDEFKIRMEEENLTCIVDIPKQPVIIYGDGEKLARAFSNLLTNAVKYGADGKQIKVALIELEEQVYVSITNYGKVIPQENLPYLFDKFYRVEQSRSVKTGGTGLGLAIAKNVVLMHDGEISARSDEKGTVFTVCLPKGEKEQENNDSKSKLAGTQTVVNILKSDKLKKEE